MVRANVVVVSTHVQARTSYVLAEDGEVYGPVPWTRLKLPVARAATLPVEVPVEEEDPLDLALQEWKRRHVAASLIARRFRARPPNDPFV